MLFRVDPFADHGQGFDNFLKGMEPLVPVDPPKEPHDDPVGRQIKEERITRIVYTSNASDQGKNFAKSDVRKR
jgi:hypothetical protein